MIRVYTPDDLEDILDAWAAASAIAHPFLGDEFLAQERRDIAELYMPRAETAVWESGGRVVGFISMLGDEIGALFVHPAWHRQGIGSALVNHVRGERRNLEVEVFAANTMGRAFYQNYGFVRRQQCLHAASGCEIVCYRLRAGSERAPNDASPRGVTRSPWNRYPLRARNRNQLPSQ